MPQLWLLINVVYREEEKMKHHCCHTNRIIAPVSLSFFGEGAPVGNDPGQSAQRSLSQTLVYLCRSEEKTAARLAEETGIPAPYIEEELERQCRGENGEYGLLRSVGKGKYIANIIIAHRDEYIAVNALYRKYAPAFCDFLTDGIAAAREGIHSFMRRNLPKNVEPELLLWAMMPDIVGGFATQVCAGLVGFFLDVRPVSRPFTVVAVADLPEQSCFYSCDSIVAHDVGGYSNVLVRNLYGSRLQAHFHCGHDVTADPMLRLTVRCADGCPLPALSHEEREIAERAIQQGYLREHDGVLEPAILVLADGISVYIEFQSLLGALEEDTRQLANDLAGELAGFMREYIPSHLLADYPCYGSSIASHCFFHDVVEECICRGILTEPSAPLGSEGVLMVLCI